MTSYFRAACFGGGGGQLISMTHTVLGAGPHYRDGTKSSAHSLSSGAQHKVSAGDADSYFSNYLENKMTKSQLYSREDR